jgi:uncharacterized membrane protein
LLASFERPSGKLKFNGILTGIVMLGIGMRVFRLSHFSLWNDELFSCFYAKLFDTHFLWSQGFWIENTPPLYYTLVAAWMHLFGASEVALRSLSVVASVMHIPLVYFLGREISCRLAGLIAALLCAFSPTLIYFAQEARTYSVLLLPTTIALISIARLIGEGESVSHGLPRSSISQTLPLALYGLSSLLAHLIHSPAPEPRASHMV